jgi:hypothetical protein
VPHDLVDLLKSKSKLATMIITSWMRRKMTESMMKMESQALPLKRKGTKQNNFFILTQEIESY